MIIHELGHAFGFWHEHTRADRDQYIEVLEENIIPDAIKNFNILPDNEWDNLTTPYDFGSIMHYRLDAFSANGASHTIRIKDGIEFTGEVGQRIAPSEVDIRQANLLYKCPTIDPNRDEERLNGKLFCRKYINEFDMHMLYGQITLNISRKLIELSLIQAQAV